MVLEETQRRRVRGFGLAFGVLAAFGLTQAPATAAGRNATEEPTLDRLAAEFESRYSAIVLHHDVSIQILFDLHMNMRSVIRERRKLLIFDAEKSPEVLDVAFTVPPGYKIKGRKASATEYRGGSMVSGTGAKESDFVERKLYGGWRELKIAIPGLTKRGYVTVEIEVEREGWPFFPIQFAQPLFVREGTCTLRVPRTADGSSPHLDAILAGILILPRGKVEKIDPKEGGMREVALAWRVKDLPPMSQESLVPAASQPIASLDVIPAETSWRDWAKYWSEETGRVKVPDKLRKATRDTLRNVPPDQVVQAIARYLDDPANFELRGDPRHLSFDVPALEDVVRDRSGDVLHKALLASRLLSECKVENHLVLGASQFRTVLDWRSMLLEQFDAVLISVPSISEDFLWDVGARWVPIGRAGADLYPSMLVLDPERKELVEKFPIEEELCKETRTIEMKLGDDGVMQGEMTLRYESFPQSMDLDPWDRTADLTETIGSRLPDDVRVTDVHWKQGDRSSMRCTSETPATLVCGIEREAIPMGESGWEVRPFFLDLPAWVQTLVEGDRKSPLLLARGLDLTEAVYVELGSRPPVDVAAPIEIRNAAGSFQCLWEPRDHGVFVMRKVMIAANYLSAQQVPLVRDLCRAWNEAEERSFSVE